jgi:L-ascorbate metabolism protein UlaG (beta-lactamase superfamily)
MWYTGVTVTRLLLVLILFQPAWARAEVSITQLANEGVLISDGQTRILIDGLVVEDYSVYGGLNGEARVHFDALTGPFADIDLVLVSHRHHEHNQPAFACQFMRSSPTTRMMTSPQVLGLMREKCRALVTGSDRFEAINPPRGKPLVTEVGSARITIFPLSHGTRKYAKIQHFGHLVEIAGMTIVHVGDAAMTAADFETAGLHEVHIDVALVPFKYFQPGPGAEIVNRYLDAPLKIAMHIPPDEMEEVKVYLAENFPRVRILENLLDTATYQPLNASE